MKSDTRLPPAGTTLAPVNVADQKASGERFAFGANWASFLRLLTPERIERAEQSLKAMLEVDDLTGLTFLDIGSGSGLFSLAARRLGARVHSFDYDAESVACARELRRRFFGDDPGWRVEEGSILDGSYVAGLGSFDLVYSWGVLHHTGQLWSAMANAALPVSVGGRLFIALYNHQVYWTRWHTAVKRLYVRSPAPLRSMLALGYAGAMVGKGLVKDVATLRDPRWRYRASARARGMSVWHDWLDWLGGYPFEAAKPDQVFDFCRARGFALERLVTVGGGHGCNEFVFRRLSGGSSNGSS